MRTTINLEDDILQAAKGLADASGQSLGAVVSTLARRGLKAATRSAAATGDPSSDLPTFRVGPDALIIPTTRAAELLAEDSA